jgi:membrane protein YqaA with SNARE-associated domain
MSLLSNEWFGVSQFLSNSGFVGIFLWGIIENGILPLPVELFVVPFIIITRSNAAVVALFGASGSILGGLLDYYVGVGGLRLFSRFSARMTEGVIRSLKRYEKYGKNGIYVALFVGRLFPLSLKPIFVVAGSARLSRVRFCVIIFVSSLIRYYMAATIGNVFLFLLR